MLGRSAGPIVAAASLADHRRRVGLPSQHRQRLPPGRRARPRHHRRRRPAAASRRRDLPDRRHRHPRGRQREVGAGSVADAEGARADTVMLVNIPADRSRVVAVSFPRDLDVTRPQCARLGQRQRPATPTRCSPRAVRRQAQRRLRPRRPEMPGQGHPEDVGPEDRPLHRHGLRRIRVHGRPGRRRRGVHDHTDHRRRTR